MRREPPGRLFPSLPGGAGGGRALPAPPPPPPELHRPPPQRLSRIAAGSRREGEREAAAAAGSPAAAPAGYLRGPGLSAEPGSDMSGKIEKAGEGAGRRGRPGEGGARPSGRARRLPLSAAPPPRPAGAGGRGAWRSPAGLREAGSGLPRARRVPAARAGGRLLSRQRGARAGAGAGPGEPRGDAQPGAPAALPGAGPALPGRRLGQAFCLLCFFLLFRLLFLPF